MMATYSVYGRKLGASDWILMDDGLNEFEARMLARDMKNEFHFPPLGIRIVQKIGGKDATDQSASYGNQ